MIQNVKALDALSVSTLVKMCSSAESRFPQCQTKLIGSTLEATALISWPWESIGCTCR